MTAENYQRSNFEIYTGEDEPYGPVLAIRLTAPRREFLADPFVLGAISAIENLEQYAITIRAREVDKDVED
jgi:hypothetical protein